MSATMRALACTALIAALGANAHGQKKEAPQLALKDLAGKTVRLKDYRGRVVLLNFWATWCPPCRAEVPDLIKLQAEHGGEGLQVVGITYPPTNRASVRRFVSRAKVNYPILLGTKESRRLFDRGETLPLTVVINREGEVAEIIEGVLLPEEFDEKIKPLLRR